MPISYHIDGARGVVLTTASGVLSDDDILQHKQRLLRDPLFKPGMLELSDVSGIDRLDVTPNGIRLMVQQDRQKLAQAPHSRLAIVVSSELAFGLGRMYQGLSPGSGENVGVFRDLPSARAWLGLS